MVFTTQVLCKYIPEWFNLQRSSGLYFKRQAWLRMTRFHKNIAWSTIKNSRSRYHYMLKLENHYAAQLSNHRRDINRSRVAAACEEHGFNYSHFMTTLAKRDICLNLHALSHLAIYEPKTFKSIVEIAQKLCDDELQPANFNPNTLDMKEDVPRVLVS